MRQQGKEHIIYPPTKQRRWETKKLMQKYGISRQTAWRFRTGRISCFHVPAEKRYVLSDWQEKILASRTIANRIAWQITKRYELAKTEADDIVSEAKVRIIEYGTQSRNADQLLGHWYKTAVWLAKTKRKFLNNLKAKNYEN